MKKTIIYIVLIIFGAIVGILANRNKEYLINAQYIRDHWHLRKKISNKKEIIESDKVMVCFTIGQSNAADYGKGIYTCKNKEIYNYYKGELYKAKEPLLGSDGDGSSVWTRVADRLIDSGLFKKVIIIPCAIGSTSVLSWSEGDSKKKLLSTLDYIAKDSIRITHVFWLQGETDNVDQTTTGQYKKRLNDVIDIFRTHNILAPFYVSITSYVPFGNDNPFGINLNITNAQHQIIAESKNVKEGPNTDSINLGYYRIQDVHYSEKGLDLLADKWFQKIK